jgi:DNA-binding NtrC family response regulator
LEASVSVVLIVDDESGIRDILARWLSAAGHEIRQAVDAETALDDMAGAAADVVMCDVEMPGHGGLWLAAQLGQRFPTTAIVLATALDSVPAVNSLQPSIVEYLVKPFSRGLVVQAVSRAVQWRSVALTRVPAARPGEDGVAEWLDDIEDKPEPG